MGARGRNILKSREKRLTFREKIRRFFRFVKWTIILLSLGAVVSWWYVHKLNDFVEVQFSKSFRWDVPSRIYADVEYLFPGLDTGRRSLLSKLDRLGYRNTGNSVKTPGEYFASSDLLEIYLHDFDYPHQKFEGFPVRIRLNGSVIANITRIDTGESTPTVRLEPEIIATVFDAKMEDRTLVSLKEVPDACLQSVVLIEDERFFKHHGVDPMGIARAMWSNLKAFRIKQGGSTLTQQLVKNYFLTSERSFKRKIKEALMALAIEQNHTKGEILEAYLNEIYLGQRGSSSVSGFGEAARLYFGKNVSQLSSAECSLLAGMIRSPHYYSPFKNPERAKSRRDFILKKLHDGGLLSVGEYKSSIEEKIVTPKRSQRIVQAPYFIDFVKQQLFDLYPDSELSAEGMRIFTSLDMTSQLIAEDSLVGELGNLEKNYGSTLPKSHKAGELQGALVSIQPQTGYIRSLVGGRDYNETKFNRVVQAKRQPGSIFKPFVYLTAFSPTRTKQVFAPSSFIYDTNFTVQAGGKNWSPKNYDKKEHGPVTLREALMKSYNIATAKLAVDVGLEEVVKTAHDAGLNEELLAVPSLALGSFEVTPLEMASAYTIFANNGIRAEPLSIINVVDSKGEVLERKSIDMERRFDPAPVYLVNQVLKDVFDFGTAAGARRLGFTGVAAGKTGTTSNYRDAWFVGYTPDILTLTWVGYDDNAQSNMSGGRAALPIWVRYMVKAHGNPTQDFQVPKNVVLVKIDPTSGKAWRVGCPEPVYAPFVEGSEPNEQCPLN